MTLLRRGWWVGRPTTPPRLGRRADLGSATAELAASLPALVLLIFAALTGVTAVRTQLECVDAASQAARAAARGDHSWAQRVRAAPPGAHLQLFVDADTVSATVSTQVHPLGGRLPGFEVAATAVAAIEPGVELEPGVMREPGVVRNGVAAPSS